MLVGYLDAVLKVHRPTEPDMLCDNLSSAVDRTCTSRGNIGKLRAFLVPEDGIIEQVEEVSWHTALTAADDLRLLPELVLGRFRRLIRAAFPTSAFASDCLKSDAELISISMNPAQCRMARAGLNWSAAQLASHAGVGYATVVRFETGANIYPANLLAMRRALEEAGIVFIPAHRKLGAGVRLRGA